MREGGTGRDRSRLSEKRHTVLRPIPNTHQAQTTLTYNEQKQNKDDP